MERSIQLARKRDTIDLFPGNKETRPDIVKKNTVGNSHNLIGDIGQSSRPLSPQAIEFWEGMSRLIRDNVSSQMWKTWFELIKPLSWEDQTLTIEVPSQFFVEWIEEHYRDLLRKTLSQVAGEDASLRYEVVVSKGETSLEDRTIRIPALRNTPATGNQSVLHFAGQNKQAEPDFEFLSALNQRYVFDNFVRGDSNQLAASAAFAVAERPGKTNFNPLFIYGGTGLGKTHLAQAIGNFIVAQKPGARVLYTNSERFTFEYVNAIQNNKLNEFTNFYRSVDVLIVDDIQFLGGKEKTQDHFFHTFNALHLSGKQVVLTSDKPPKELLDIDARLISRFQWGLSADIQLPDFEMRMAILQKKSQDEGFELQHDVAEYIAKNINGNVRELEGALIKLIAKISLDSRVMGLDLAKEVVQGIAGTTARQLSMDSIAVEVSSYYQIPVELLSAKTRKHEVVIARQMTMYLIKMLIGTSLKSIGAHFGGRDHTTVLHSCQTIDNYLGHDIKVRTALETLKSNLLNR
ncbi:MAG: chromosomal replication initiator protein DnaA [Bacteroidota bacterium]